MEFGWSAAQEQQYLTTMTAAAKVSPGDGPRRFVESNWRMLGELGLLGASVPAADGGLGLNALDTARMFEAAGRGCADTGLLFGAAAHLFACAMPMVHAGDEKLRQRFLPGMCSGDLVAANCMTEELAGSDVSRLATTAVAVPGGFVIDGTKTFVTNGPVADVYVVYATTDPKAGQWGLTAFVVEADAPGVTAGEPFAKLGMEGCEAGTVAFQNCFVEAASMLGAEGQGSAVFQDSMGWERACLFAMYLGVQDRLIEVCVEHARGRRQFGRQLSEFQSVSNRIVEMKLRVESARLLLYRACWAMDTGKPAVLVTALSKLATTEGAVASGVDAVQLLGGRGYLRGHSVEAALRDAMGGTIFSGTSDIQRQLVAMELGL
jgi:alkylation response protein AidB-like acyl-CoA dehydrogenase